MVVVSDSSPLIALVNIGLVELLPSLCGEIFVPPEVMEELRSEHRPELVREFAVSPPRWLVTHAATSVEPIAKLDMGERAAISLASDLHADLLLIDDSRARKAAASRHLAIMGVVGLLERAAQRGLIDLAEAFERLRKTDFWISNELLDERLRTFQQQITPTE
jgi:predicted nucleic acid-binding protein